LEKKTRKFLDHFPNKNHRFSASSGIPPLRRASAKKRAIDQAWDLRVWFLRHRSQPNMMKVQKQSEIPEKPGIG
jgi:hypothetical protein